MLLFWKPGCITLMLLLGASLNLSAQQASQNRYRDSLKMYESKLKQIGDSMVDGKHQATRVRSLKRFIRTFQKAVKTPGSFDYPFDTLSYLFTFTPPDEKFRLYNWHIEFADQTFRYYGVIQMNNSNQTEVYPLYDRVEDALLNAQDTVLGPEGWYGAQYFKMIQQKIKGKKYYTLLGWDGFNNRSNRKLIDVLYFNSNNEPQFGAPIFRKEGNTLKRVIWKYNNKATMEVEYDPEEKVIAFDHLVPPNRKMEGHQHTYIPDGTYDYYKYQPERSFWQFKKQYFPEDFSPAEDSENANDDDS